MPRERPERPDIDSQGGAWPEPFVVGNDEAELEMSVESRSFVNRVNDQLRKRQEQLSIPCEYNRSHTQTNVLQDWCLNKMRSQDWTQLNGIIIHGNFCHQLVTKESSIFNARRSTSF